MLKVKPHPDYPPEEGTYLRGNDYSSSAVVIILNTDQDKVPPFIDSLVRAGHTAGAALSGLVQTANIGIEKIVCNIVANPNIRYLILGGPESEGHSTGDAIKCLLKNGVDEKKRIRGTEALYPVLYNISADIINRFREQVTLVDLQFRSDPEIIKEAVRSCFQEEPVDFNGQALFDPGAYDGEILSGKISWNVTKPWAVPASDDERTAQVKAEELIEKLKERNRKRGFTG